MADKLIGTLTQELEAVKDRNQKKAAREKPVHPQRKETRGPARFMVVVRVGRREVVVKARDLSAGGMFLESSDLQKGFLARIQLPGDQEELVLRCTVRRATEEGVAVAFSELSYEERFRIEQYLKRA